MTMQIWIPGKPKGKARARTTMQGGYAHSYTPEETVLYENYIKLSAQQQNPDWKPLSGCVSMHIEAVYEIPKGWSKKRRAIALQGFESPTVKPDADNIAKVICDALNGIAYADDKQIVRMEITKTYGAAAGVEVLVSCA